MPMDQTLITRIVEAALMAANQPLTLAQLHGLFSLDDPAPDGSVEQALETLREQCEDRGVELVELASGFRFQVKADVHAWVARLGSFISGWSHALSPGPRFLRRCAGSRRRRQDPRRRALSRALPRGNNRERAYARDGPARRGA